MSEVKSGGPEYAFFFAVMGASAAVVFSTLMSGMWGHGHQLEICDGEGRPMADAGGEMWGLLLGQALHVGNGIPERREG